METQMEITMDDTALMEPGIQILVEKLDTEPHLFDRAGDSRWLELLVRVLHDETIFTEAEHTAVREAARRLTRKLFTAEVLSIVSSSATPANQVGESYRPENAFEQPKNFYPKEHKGKLEAEFSALLDQVRQQELRKNDERYKREMEHMQRKIMQQSLTTGVGLVQSSNTTNAFIPASNIYNRRV